MKKTILALALFLMGSPAFASPATGPLTTMAGFIFSAIVGHIVIPQLRDPLPETKTVSVKAENGNYFYEIEVPVK